MDDHGYKYPTGMDKACQEYVDVAGGGIRGGVTYGATDELGYNALEDVVHVRDLHATMLRVLGINHRRFAVRFQGLDLRLTGVEEAHVVKGILA
jgi:hypothetical protein